LRSGAGGARVNCEWSPADYSFDFRLCVALKPPSLRDGEQGRRLQGDAVILIVDDEPTSRTLLEMVLKQEDVVIRQAASGQEALRLLTSSEPCQLVISDIRMPEMDGCELLARMRADPRTATIPVIMVTNVADRDTVVDMIGQGVRDYIVKPFKPSTVLARVRAALADENAVIELRGKTIERLKIAELEYVPLASATVPVLDRLSGELVAALRARNAKAVRAIAERVTEPASRFGGRFAIAAACRVLETGSDLEVLHCGGYLVTELGELRSALQRVAAVRTVF
jgi:DNA-binding response OmpR family regulator